MDVFVPYGGLHALAVAVCALLIAAPTLLARALPREAEVVFRRMLAALAVCYWLAYNAWWNWHGVDLRTGLPLHICDVNGLIAPLALLTGWRWARATLYFWTSGADAAGVHSAGAGRRTGIAGVLGVLDRAHDHHRLRRLRPHRVRLSSKLERSRLRSYR